MKVLVIEPHKKPYAKEVEHTLENLQRKVGGLIEPIYLDGDCVMVCDEEGWLKENRQLNVVASAYLVLKTKDYREKHNIGVPGPLVGNVLVCTTKEFQGEEEN
jgi:hypothetical protein